MPVVDSGLCIAQSFSGQKGELTKRELAVPVSNISNYHTLRSFLLGDQDCMIALQRFGQGVMARRRWLHRNGVVVTRL